MGCLIKNDKTSIHCGACIGAFRNGDGMGVATQIITLLKQGHPMGFQQEMGSYCFPMKVMR